MSATLVLAVLSCAAMGESVAADTVTVHAEKHGSVVTVDARALVTAPLPLIWATLTDYDRLSTFIPGMQVSRVMERRGAAIMVQQVGEAGLFFFKRPIDVVVESLEKPPYVIEVRVMSGNLRKLDGRYKIEPDAQRPGSFVLRWYGVIEPQDHLPPLVGLAIVRANIGEQFRGMVREIERRKLLLRDEVKN